jgi:hypothetical protein
MHALETVPSLAAYNVASNQLQEAGTPAISAHLMGLGIGGLVSPRLGKHALRTLSGRGGSGVPGSLLNALKQKSMFGALATGGAAMEFLPGIMKDVKDTTANAAEQTSSPYVGLYTSPVTGKQEQRVVPKVVVDALQKANKLDAKPDATTGGGSAWTAEDAQHFSNVRKPLSIATGVGETATQMHDALISMRHQMTDTFNKMPDIVGKASQQAAKNLVGEAADTVAAKVKQYGPYAAAALAARRRRR